ncbi:MAG: hypothetical protein JWR58_5669 [Pseudonocardia sp.]|jgi:hypothetical protein|nr:hypothetical protein [Pseudonocardia sp.]
MALHRRGLPSENHLYDEVVRSGELHVIDNFFHEVRRYG